MTRTGAGATCGSGSSAPSATPAERFREDGLRPLRACRFAAQLGFTVEEATLAAIPGSLDILAKVSAESACGTRS